MKHTKPTMSWAVDKNHLDQHLARYWQKEYNLLVGEIQDSIEFVESNEILDSLDREELLIMLNNSIE